MIIRQGDTASLKVTVQDKNGLPIRLDGHILRWKAENYTNTDPLFSVAATSFEGDDLNIARFEIEDETTDLFKAKPYKTYLELETAQGQEYRSRKILLIVSKDLRTSLDRTIRINDNIICYCEDDVVLQPGNPTPPTSIQATGLTIQEGNAIGAVVGQFTSIGDYPKSTWSISDNINFAINSAGQLTAKVVFDYDAQSSYPIIVTATNSEGSHAESFTVNIQEVIVPNNRPVIALVGGNVTIPYNGTYNEPGFTATDTEDGNITGNVVVTGSVDPGNAGQYILRYNVADSQGLAAIERTRTVTVEEEVITNNSVPYTVPFTV